MRQLSALNITYIASFSSKLPGALSFPICQQVIIYSILYEQILSDFS